MRGIGTVLPEFIKEFWRKVKQVWQKIARIGKAVRCCLHWVLQITKQCVPLILWIFIAGCFASLIWTLDSEEIPQILKRAIGDEKKQEIIRFVGWGMGGLLAAVVALALNRRAEEMAKNNKLVEEGHINERFKAATESLASGEPSARIASFYQFYYLAKKNPDEDFRKNIFEILCAHLRNTTSTENYRTKRGKDNPTEEIQSLLDVLFKSNNETVFAGIKANLRGVYLVGANLTDTKLQKTDFQNAKLKKANFQNAKLQKADFQNTESQKTNFEDAELQEANFEEAKLQEANFLYAKLQQARFCHAELQQAIFINVELQEADFWNAKLRQVCFNNSRLQYAYFGGTELQETNFGMAELKNAFFRRVKLQDANFSNVKNADKSKFEVIEINKQTMLPPNIVFTYINGKAYKTDENGKPHEIKK